MPMTNRTLTTVLGLATGATLTLAACGGGGDSARDEAIDRAVEQGIRREIAECVVDASTEEWGEAALDPTFEVPPDEIGRSVEILDRCLFRDE